MVMSIARQSVIIKCNMQKSVLTGNYEFYYAAGLISKISQIEIEEDIKPLKLEEYLAEKIKILKPNDEKEAWLFHMIHDYKPAEEYDDQMKELMRWGKNEQYLWAVVIPS